MGVKHVLKLECINDNWGMPPEVLVFVPLLNDGKRLPNRYWVAEITGRSNKYKFERKFLNCKKDYTESNSTGTRGVYAYYILEEGKIYEVSSPQTWSSTDRYFCTIENGNLIRLSSEEVENLNWLKSDLG